MSKRILIVEGDAQAAQSLRADLEPHGFEVEELFDGKAVLEHVRKTRPELVLLAVELGGGQNGYLVCGKLKKDEELRSTPIVIMGNPDGFAQHAKLKTRADDYLARPVPQGGVLDPVGRLIGLPEQQVELAEDESLTLSDLIDDDEPSETDAGGEAVLAGDPDLDMLDAAFDGISEPPSEATQTAIQTDAPGEEVPVTFDALEEGGDLADESTSLELEAPEELATDAAIESLGFDEPAVETSDSEEDAALDALGFDEPPVVSSDNEEDAALDALGFDEPPVESSDNEEDAALDALGLDEPAVESSDSEEDAALDSLDFDAPSEGPAEASPQPTDETWSEDSFGLADDTAAVPLQEQAAPPPPPTAAPPSRGADTAELKTLRRRLAELQRSLDEAEARANEATEQAQNLSAELAGKKAELEAARASTGRNDKDFFALREASTKKDKEILKLKNELNQKDQEIVELREREMHLEQQGSESSQELARSEAQLKTLAARVEQASSEKRRFEQQLTAAKEEARTASEQSQTLEEQARSLQEQKHSLQEQHQALQAQLADVQGQLEASRGEAEEARQRAEGLDSELGSLRSEQGALTQDRDELRERLEQGTGELEQLRASLGEKDTELEGLRRRATELEESGTLNEERLTRLYQRIKGEEEVRDRTRKALEVAMKLLDQDEPPLSAEDQQPEGSAIA